MASATYKYRITALLHVDKKPRMHFNRRTGWWYCERYDHVAQEIVRGRAKSIEAAYHAYLRKINWVRDGRPTRYPR